MGIHLMTMIDEQQYPWDIQVWCNKFLFVVSCCNADRENLENTSSNTSLAMDNKNCIVNTKWQKNTVL